MTYQQRQHRYGVDQTWSSRDLSLGLETRITSLGLEPRHLGLGTSESWSRNPRVLVSVLVMGLGTVETLGLKWHTVTYSNCCIHC